MSDPTPNPTPSPSPAPTPSTAAAPAGDASSLLYGLGGTMPAPTPSSERVSGRPAAPEPAAAEDPGAEPAPLEEEPGAAPEEEPGGEPGSEPGAGPEGGELSFGSFQELFEHFDIDWESAKDLPVEISIEGETKAVPFSDVIKGFRGVEVAERRLAEVRAQAKEVSDGLAQKLETVNEQYAVAAALIQTVEQQLDDDTANIDWAKLRREDPAEYAAKKDDIAERRAQIQALKDKAVDGYRQGQEKLRQVDPKALQARVEKVEAYIVERLPDWSDAQTAEKGTAALTAYLAADGFTPEQVRNGAVQNPALLVYAEKARRYDEMMAKSQAAKKKIVTVPKVLKPGGKKAEPAAAPAEIDPVKALYG